MCAAFHLEEESVPDFTKRLGHREWPGGGQPDTFEDAVSLLDREPPNRHRI
jgi:hypothetical protein